MAALQNRYEVIGIDRTSIADGQTLAVDLADNSALSSVFDELGSIDYILHLAAESRIDASWESVLQNNIIATRNLYECVKQATLRNALRVRKIVFASSNNVAGAYLDKSSGEWITKELNERVLSEADPVRPNSDYATSKLFGESLARQYYELPPHLPSICLRLGAVLDDHDDPTNSQWHQRAWLSHRDLVHLFERAMLSEQRFGVYYGVSNNTEKFWDTSLAEVELGYDPQDNAAIMPRSLLKRLHVLRSVRKLLRRVFPLS